MSNLSQEAWATQLASDSNACIVDVRTSEEIEEGYIPGAIHLNLYLRQAFLEALEKLDKNKNYYIYCKSGSRSGQACMLMKRMGIANAYNLQGGFMKWEGEIVA